jgi:hypothetical protein
MDRRQHFEGAAQFLVETFAGNRLGCFDCTFHGLIILWTLETLKIVPWNGIFGASVN